MHLAGPAEVNRSDLSHHATKSVTRDGPLVTLDEKNCERSITLGATNDERKNSQSC